MSTYFKGYGGTGGEGGSTTGSVKASGGYFKGYGGSAYDSSYTPPSATVAAPKSAHNILQDAIKFVGQKFIKPVVDSTVSGYHAVHAAGMAVTSVAEGHHGAQLAADKAKVQAEFNRGHMGQAAPELAGGSIDKTTGKFTPTAPLTLKTARRAGGAALEDSLNIASVLPVGGSVRAGKAAVTAAKAVGETGLKDFARATGKQAIKAGAGGAGYGAGYGAASVAQQDKIDPKAAAKEIGMDTAVGGAAGAGLSLLGGFLGRGAKPVISKASKVVNDVVDKVKPGAGGGGVDTPTSIFNHVPTVAEGDTHQPILNQKFVQAKYGEMKQAVQDAAKGMSEADKQRIDKIEIDTQDGNAAADHLDKIAGGADNPAQFRQVTALMREAYNHRRAGDVALGRDVGFVHNYLPHIYDTTDKGTADALEHLNLQAAKAPGYTKARTIPTYETAARLEPQYGQLKRKNANSLDDFYESMDRAGNDHGVEALKQGIEQAHPGVQVGDGKIGFDPKSGQRYDQLDISGGRRLSLPADLAAEYNKRAPSKNATGAVGVYDKVNAGFKTSILGGGTFHMLTTFGTMTGRQIASGDLFKHPILNLKIVAGTFNKAAHEANMGRFAENGTLDKARLSGVTLGANDIRGDVGGPHGIPIIKDIHDAVFKRQIPEAKLTIFEQATKGLDANNPEHLAYMRKVASAVNNLGGINRAVSGLTPKQAKVLSRVLLATDFTEGKFRTIGAALTRGGVDGKIARQMVVGKSILFALPGLTALTLAGKIDWSDPNDVQKNIMEQFIDPAIPLNEMGAGTKSNPGGTPQAAHLPSTFISELGKVIKPALDPLAPDKLSGVKDYLTNRVAALPAVASRVAQNKDFYGNPLIGRDLHGNQVLDKNGNPISAVQSGLNILGQVAPIPTVQGGKLLTGGQSVKDSVLNTAGFRVSADKTSLESGHSQAISDLYNTYNAVNTQQNKVTKKITDLISQGNVNQAHSLAQQWNAQLESKVRPTYDKHAGDFNKPAWDAKFKSLQIKTSSRSDLQRKKDAKANADLLK